MGRGYQWRGKGNDYGTNRERKQERRRRQNYSNEEHLPTSQSVLAKAATQENDLLRRYAEFYSDLRALTAKANAQDSNARYHKPISDERLRSGNFTLGAIVIACAEEMDALDMAFSTLMFDRELMQRELQDYEHRFGEADENYQ